MPAPDEIKVDAESVDAYDHLIDEMIVCLRARDRAGAKKILQDRYLLGLQDGHEIKSWRKKKGGSS